MNIAIVGYGWVGKSMHRIFPDAVIYDEYLKIYDRDTKIEIDIRSRDAVNACDIALVCVPTPICEASSWAYCRDEFCEDCGHSGANGEHFATNCSKCGCRLFVQPSSSHIVGHAEVSIVREVCSWIDGPIICIKSAVPPGTVNALLVQYPTKQIVVSPEYIGEGPTWDGTITDTWASEDSYSREELARRWPYVIVGGPITQAQIVLDAYEECLGDAVEYLHEENTTTVELVKYMENVWLAMQVTWANEFHDIADAVGADYEAARDLWAYDPRVSAHHTDVLPERGFGGKCLPKDLAAIICTARQAGYNPGFLQAIQYTNERFRRMNT